MKKGRMRIFPTNKPQIFISMGDPAGIGPEIIAKALIEPEIRDLAVYVIVGDSDVISGSFERFSNGTDQIVHLTNSREDVILDEDRINILDPDPLLKVPFRAGVPTEEGARKTLDSITFAATMLQNDVGFTRKAMVTAPVNKSEIARVSPGFIGHTEYLRDFFAASSITMVLIGEKLCVVPVTRHIPVKDVARALTQDVILENMKNVLRYKKIISGKDEPAIGVCALNPHSGENGTIGREEIDIITPAVEETKKLYSNITGPVPADVAFYKALKGQFDIVIAMYHDQGLGPFKMIDFDNGVNMTLGLGQIRTSPDHGTAYDIAGKDIASAESMGCAISLAVRAAENN